MLAIESEHSTLLKSSRPGTSVSYGSDVEKTLTVVGYWN